MSLKDLHNGKSWHEWDEKYQFMDARTRKAVLTDLSDSLSYYRFIQFIFFRQWHALKAYANKKGIAIIGDIPIFVSPDSADVWANQSLFKLDSKGFPTSVAGVPPDYFSATGQLWGNPLYNWAEHKKTGYAWWIARIRQQLQLCDYLRIDQFCSLHSMIHQRVLFCHICILKTASAIPAPMTMIPPSAGIRPPTKNAGTRYAAT